MGAVKERTAESSQYRILKIHLKRRSSNLQIYCTGGGSRFSGQRKAFHLSLYALGLATNSKIKVLRKIKHGLYLMLALL